MAKVVVGMSGGVDSSVAAYLLKKQGYEVIGLTLEMQHDFPQIGNDAQEASETCKALGISHHITNIKNDFEATVVNNFVSEYLKGHTPNPCVMCNKEAKWKGMISYADTIGAEFVATGHYANIIKLPNGRFTIANSKAATKDQTYVLARLSQKQLSRTLMPLGEFGSKDNVREIAAELGLLSANKKDSQDICFVNEDSYVDFLEERTNHTLPGEGNFVDKDGNILGKHKGIANYTVGQRKGLGIALGVPAFVLSIKPETNEVVLGFGNEIFSDRLICSDMNFVAVDSLLISEPVKLLCRVRYHHAGEMCTAVRINDNEVQVVFEKPVRAITPGQTAVFYKDNYVFMSGTIVG